MAKVKPFRDSYLAAHFFCEVCIKRKSESVHEITRGPAREASLDKPELVLAVCEKCHRLLENYAIWPVSRQLALKWLRSPGLLNMDLVNSTRGRAPGAITLEDVAAHLELKR